MHTAAVDAGVHHAFIDRLRQTGYAPSRHEVSATLAKPVKEIDETLYRLAESHGVVLHPHICEPWVIHPFSFSPTATWVQQGSQGWWAPCIWCGCGIAALVGGNAVIHARLGGEMEDIDIHIDNGKVVENDLWAEHILPFRHERHGTMFTTFAPPLCLSGRPPRPRCGANDTEFRRDWPSRALRFRIWGGNGMPIIAIATGANGPSRRRSRSSKRLAWSERFGAWKTGTVASRLHAVFRRPNLTPPLRLLSRSDLRPLRPCRRVAPFLHSGRSSARRQNGWVGW